MSKSTTIMINLTKEQVAKLKPLVADWPQWRADDNRVMFAGQVLTAADGTFHRVKFGIIPANQALEIEKIRGLDGPH